MHRLLIATASCLAIALPAAAQDVGGLPLSRQALAAGGPSGLAKPLPFVAAGGLTAHDAQGGLTAADRSAINQQAIASIRGDAGFLAGFSNGVPLSPSVQPVQSFGGGFGRRRHAQVTINNFDGPVAFSRGNGNQIQLQQASSASGPVALQQSGGGAGASGGAVNLVGVNGNIVQRSAR